MADAPRVCVICEDAPAADHHGLCLICLGRTQQESEQGLAAFRHYLSRWAAFDRWLADHGRL